MILPAYCGSVIHSDHGPDSRLLADEREAPHHWRSPLFGLTNRILSSATRIIRRLPEPARVDYLRLFVRLLLIGEQNLSSKAVERYERCGKTTIPYARCRTEIIPT